MWSNDSSRRFLAPTAVGAAVFFVYLATAQYTSAQSVDTISAMLPAWKLALHGTLAIPEFGGATPWIHDVNGTVVSDRMPGVILFGVPFYRFLGSPGAPTFYPAAVAAAAASAAAMTCLFVLLRRLVGVRLALATTLLAAFGTATWTISAAALWPHGPDQLWLVAGMLGLAARRHVRAGLAFAAAILTRPHLAIVAAVAGLWAGIDRRSLRPVWQVGSASLIGVAGLLFYTGVAYGRVGHFAGIYGASSDQMALVNPTYVAKNVVGTLISPERGVLVLSPFLLLLLPGTVSAWRVAPAWVKASAGGGLGYLLFQLVGNRFTGGGGFYSYRYPIETLTLLVPLLVLCWVTWTSQLRWRRVAFAVLAWLAVFQHAVGAILYGGNMSGPNEAWQHYLLIDGLEDGTPLTYCALVLFLAPATWIIWRFTASAGQPADAEAEHVALSR